MNHDLLHAAVLLLAAFATAAAVLFWTLVLLRLAGMGMERRRNRQRESIRNDLFELMMSGPEEASRARTAMSARSGRAWRQVESVAFEMLPKVKGEARAALVDLLADRGAVDRALRASRSLSSERRCRSAFALGALGETSEVPRLIELLDDRSFLVCRTAVRALGSLGDSTAVSPLLDLAAAQPRLARDLIHALYRIGPKGAPVLRAEVELGLATGSNRNNHAELAATVLGLIGDLPSADVLVCGLSGRPGLAVASAEALGRIGTPDAVPALVAALDSGNSARQLAAAGALGSMGSTSAVGPLLDVVEAEDPELSRRAAESLRRIGAEGIAALCRSNSPYAVEALALQDLRQSR